MTHGMITPNQFKLLYDMSDNYVFLMRKVENTFVYACINKKAEEIFPSCPIGKSLEECLDEYHYKPILNYYNRAFVERKSIVYQDNYIKKVHTSINETMVIPIYDGEDQYILATTKEMASTQELKASTYILESYKKGISGAALVAMTNRDGIVEMVNSVFETTCQFEKHEIIGKTFCMINSNYHDDSFFENMWATINGGNIWRGEIRNRTKAGSFYWVDANIIPIQNEYGIIEKFLTIQFDITEKKRVIRELRKIERTFNLITKHSNDLIAITDEEGYLLYASPSHESILQYEKEELLGRYYLSILKEQSLSEITGKLFSNTNENSTWRTELSLKAKDGTIICTDTAVTTVKQNSDGEEEKMFVIVSREITERLELEYKLKFMAYHDSLTGLPNRRSFHENLPLAIQSVSVDFPNLALIYIDGDNFKTVNDEFGHEIGDQFLIHFAEKLQDSVSLDFTVYRIGGDEFIIIVDNINDYRNGYSAKVQTIVHAIQEKLKIGWEIENNLFTPTSSIGISMFPNDGINVDELLDNADQALYIAKKLGKNNYVYSYAVQN